MILESLELNSLQCLMRIDSQFERKLELRYLSGWPLLQDSRIRLAAQGRLFDPRGRGLHIASKTARLLQDVFSGQRRHRARGKTGRLQRSGCPDVAGFREIVRPQCAVEMALPVEASPLKV